ITIILSYYITFSYAFINLNSIFTISFFLSRPRPHYPLHSFPTRRSSDLRTGIPFGWYFYTGSTRGQELYLSNVPFMDSLSFSFLDRKSTRLNSSHGSISYAVFCLKKKKSQL